MKIVSIEPTPSPNSMKLNLDESLPKGVKFTYTRENEANAPAYARKLLAVEGVRSVFHTADFIAIDRFPKFNWQAILAEVREILGGGEVNADSVSAAGTDPYGEVKVMLQHFRGIPIQVRANNGTEEKRKGLPERFHAAIMAATTDNPFLLKERKLEELGVRYGELDEVLEQVVQEIDAAYDDERLAGLVDQAKQQTGETEPARPRKLTGEQIRRQLDDADWKKRYAALEQIEPSSETLPLLVKALKDENPSIRRLAAVYLAEVKEAEVLPYLFEALKDPSASVRRTVGDTLSDLGDPAAIGPMTQALGDPNKLVRWRAARFLYEVGDESALPALRKAQGDPEFEVDMQIRLALERIEGGHEAAGTVWQQMTRRNR